ncbi:hypothetical protein [uncultured Algibacter sp.]|uniref:hypothetical protein n=1 Tax=uncultured Algibacter sp. TaxID=298659 RepID=UPI00262ACA67|nr:hypothetical protein [uncultured Algibacter sp.]
MIFTKQFYFFIGIFLLFLITGCNIEPFEGEIPENPNPVSCPEALQNTTEAVLAFNNATVENYAELCANYKAALEAQIAICGDEGGAFQLVIDGLGDCGGTIIEDGDYWPMTIGNKWTFSQQINNIPQEETSMEIGGVENYQGVSSYYYNNFLGAAQATDGTGFENLSIKYYSRKNNGDYHVLVSELTAELTGLYSIDQSAYEYIILKDYLPVGSTWTTSFDVITTYTPLDDAIPAIPNITSNYKIDCEILEKNISLVVGSETFPDVIKISFKQETSVEGFPASSATVDYKYYFAKDVGVVKVEGSILDADSNVTSNVLQELTSYTIN